MIKLSQDGINVDALVKIPFIDDCYTALASAIERVQQIAVSMPAPYTIFVSGGIDSQAMLYAWLKSGVEFQAVHVNYHGFNDHDRDEMFEFARKHGAEITELKFDVLDFLENRFDSYARKYRCASPQICTHMAFSELIETGTKVFSGNFPMQHFSHMDNTIFGLQRYATLSGTSMVPFFFNEGEAAAKAFSLNSVLVNTDSGFEPYALRCQVYHESGFPVIPQKNKQTGFELLKSYYDLFPKRVTPRMKLRHASLPSNRVFDHLFRNPYLIEFANHYSVRFELTDKP